MINMKIISLEDDTGKIEHYLPGQYLRDVCRDYVIGSASDEDIISSLKDDGLFDRSSYHSLMRSLEHRKRSFKIIYNFNNILQRR